MPHKEVSASPRQRRFSPRKRAGDWVIARAGPLAQKLLPPNRNALNLLKEKTNPASSACKANTPRPAGTSTGIQIVPSFVGFGVQFELLLIPAGSWKCLLSNEPALSVTSQDVRASNG